MSTETMSERLNGKLVHIADIYTEALAVCFDRNGKPPELPILTLPEISKRIWGFKKKKLNLIAGRPSQGKSALMAQIAIDMALQGKTVAFFTYEMTLQVMMERAIANWCEVDSFDLLTGRIGDMMDKYNEKMKKFYNDLRNTKLILVEGFGKTYAELMYAIEKLDTQVDAVFIDYVQMISPEKGKTRKDALDEYLRALRDLAIERDFSAIVASQINRGTHDGHKIRQPEMWELKGSGELEEIADMIWLVHWAYKYSHDEDEKNKYWLHIAKNRDGRTGVVDNLLFIPEFLKVKEDDHEGDGYTGRTRNFGTYCPED